MGCPSPTTEYKFEYKNANVIGGTEGTVESDCPPYDKAWEAPAFFEAERKFKEYLESKKPDPCGPGCQIHTTTPWVPVPKLAVQMKLKRIFFSINCPTKEDETRTCLYSFEMTFFYNVLQRTVTCIPNLEGPNDFFLPQIQLEIDCKGD